MLSNIVTIVWPNEARCEPHKACLIWSYREINLSVNRTTSLLTTSLDISDAQCAHPFLIQIFFAKLDQNNSS